jgi:hypothetical protein
MKKILLSTITAAYVANIYAYDIALHAVDSQGDDESYATCRIYALPDTLEPVVVGIADSLGAVDQLNEVTVTAQRPLVVKKIDRIGYDVQADPQVLTLSTRDMLRNVPMVSVDGDGNIKVNGSSNFKVYKNGRPNNSMSKNAKDILAAIPASMIKTIEVITEPGAKYDAEGIGAILNIVTVNNASIKGVLGSAGFGYDVWKGMYNGNFFITTQIDKFTFSLNGGVQRQTAKLTRNKATADKVYKNGIVEHNEQDSNNRGYVSWVNGEGSWEINNKNLITFELGGFFFNVKPRGAGYNYRTDADGNLLSSYKTNIDYPKYGYIDFNGNINYQLSTARKGETLTASYAVSTTDQNVKQSMTYSDVVGDLFSYSAINGASDLNFIEHTFQADWVHPFTDIHSLEVGGKYILRRNVSNNNTEYTGWTTTYNEFKHITDVGALYAQYTAKIRKVSLRAGVRYEYSHLQADFPDGSADSFGSNLHDFVPSASASWNINDANSLSANYAARINRPGISYLNPTVSYSPTTVSQGNPDLESAYSNSLKLTYMLIKKKINFNISANYSFNNDNITAVQYADNNGVIHSTYDNIGHERQLAFSGFMQWTITPKTRFMFNGELSYHKYEQQGLSLSRWAPQFFTNLNQTLPLNIKLNASAYYFGSGINDVYSYYRAVGSKIIGFSIGLSRAFLKGDRLNVSVSGSDFFGNRNFKFQSTTVNGDYTGTTLTCSRRGYLQFRITYRFGSLNASVKKTATSIKNDDLIGRK